MVLAREVDLADVKKIRKAAKIPIEVFVHGALCVSYSGNCLMSGLIGYRSGNGDGAWDPAENLTNCWSERAAGPMEPAIFCP